MTDTPATPATPRKRATPAKKPAATTPAAAKAPATRKPAAAKAPVEKAAVEKKGLVGAHVFLTGATGFVGQAVLERLLSSHPDTRVSILVRTKGSATTETRLANLMRKPVFKAWKESVGEEEAARIVAERVRVVDGSLTSIADLPNDIDVVIHGASTVSFDPPIDEAFDTNVGGALGLYGALLASGSDPHVVHVSTCYVGGIRKGILPEASLTHDVDWRTEAVAAKQAREQVELASREPENLRRFINRSRAVNGKAGPQAVAQAAETARAEWVTKQLVDYGRTRAESLGWTDVYTLTKAFGERAAEELWAQAGHRLSVVRPAIIESALSHPFPGWIDGFKVADPLILAYGRGQLPDFPGLPDSILDIIPVDFVVNAIIAAAGTDADPADPKYYHVSSGASNPLPFHEMYENVNEFFTANPLPHEDGHISVPLWRFPGALKVERALKRREDIAEFAERNITRLPSTKRTQKWLDGVHTNQSALETLRGYTELYRAYVQTEIIFDDANTKALHHSIPEDKRSDLGFDVAAIDWNDYFQRVHFPAITALTKAFANRPSSNKRGERPLPVRSDVLAVFDLEGTVLESNLVQQYLWLGITKTFMTKELVSLGLAIPKYLRAEHRDRGDFIRTFMRRYEGIKVARIEALVRGRFGRQLLSHVIPDALRRAQAHREAGHRTVLVTGTIDLMTTPLAPFFDEIVAGSMHVRDGVLTGYLATPPLVDEARASWLRQYAKQHGANLSQSYGYGDSHADVPWLQLLGHPTAVNPDTQLYSHAQAKRWAIQTWGGRSKRDDTAAPNTPVSTSPEKGEQQTVTSAAASNGI
ncbi:HAD superfamily hydrolase (TIGR01490 family) [Conyzicola lurida]|uniref:HAD superfamily hydrolase (TIGR01490 family) n=1 Tax=Conyzicola lurida TaxID=1172621 RepID=A0A841ALN6_9MICO|nr:HAD-IB family hydrolase [Conyzicola lurida]MBB5844127.1 HAD superfamily hydrolase (TIGR01490 family) [Conyzicola lurida]